MFLRKDEPTMFSKNGSIAAALLLVAGTTLVGTAGPAAATVNPPPSSRPSQCPESDYTAHVETPGSLLCWYADTATVKICDTLADNHWAGTYIQENSGWHLFITGGYDKYGSGGCVWYYPPASVFDYGGQIHIEAIVTDANSDVMSPSPTLTEPW